MSSQASSVRLAVIGAGLIGHRHLQYIVDEPRCRLTGVVDPSLHAKTLSVAEAVRGREPVTFEQPPA